MNKKLVHISDLHFGKEHPAAVAQLDKEIKRLKPDLVVASGDFTQRATKKQFEKAAAFLNQIPFPKIVIPGNHDVPLLNLIQRIRNPLKKYKHYITDELYPVFSQKGLFVLGINSTSALFLKKGRITKKRAQEIAENFKKGKKQTVKVLVMHHNLIPTPDRKRKQDVRVSKAFIEMLEKQKVDLILSGHIHRTYCGDLLKHYPSKRSIIIAQAGTAVSRIKRYQPNSFNFITIGKGELTIEARVFIENRFRLHSTNQFIKDKNQWRMELSRPELGE